MEEKREPNVKLLRSTLQNGVTQLLAAGICSAVLFLFVALTYSQITLPGYTAAYDQKDTQQVVNLLITVVATVIGILLTHCRRLTNEAETRSELRNAELTIPRLHVHFEAAGGSKTAMSFPAAHNRSVLYLVLVYLSTMIVFGFLHSVLSVIFVVEGIISEQGETVPVYVPLSIDVPETYDGEVVDPCTLQILSPGCTYDLALTSFTSELVTINQYTWGGVTFEPPNGTLGLPYYVMQHFSDQVKNTHFEEEHRQYCVPVLEPRQITCTEEPFNQTLQQTESNLVQFKPLRVFQNTTSGRLKSAMTEGINMYKITMPYPSDEPGDIKYRTNDEGQGTFVTHMSLDDPYISIIAASNSGPDGYASLLYRMMYDKEPDLSAVPRGQSFYFVAKCELSHIIEQDNTYSSWRQVDFTLRNGVLKANVTEERCMSPKGPKVSGFKDLQFYLEGAGVVLSTADGYSNLFNDNIEQGIIPKGAGSTIFDGMSRLDATVNKIYHLVQTAWTEQTYNYSMKSPGVKNEPIIMTNYPHLYVIRISWTPTTYIGLVLSTLITLNAYVLFGRWARAVYRFGFEAETWNLLRPVDLMAYSLAAWHDLVPDLRTLDQRRAAMRGETHTILKEHPGWQPTETPLSPASTAVATSPISAFAGKVDSPVNGTDNRPGITVQTTERDLEKGA